jgi:hypothetical protein
MIYFTTFILTLLLSYIVRATPACGDVVSPEELYDPTYADAADGQHVLPIILYNVTWSNKYDNKNGNEKSSACSSLAHRYPHYKDFPDFPYIGGAWNVKPPNNQYCGSCWNLTDLKTHKTISVAIVDSAKTGYNISKKAFKTLNGGNLGTWLQAEAKQVSPHYCGFKIKK